MNIDKLHYVADSVIASILANTTEDEKVFAIIMLNTYEDDGEEIAATMLHGYVDTRDALKTLMLHVQEILRAMLEGGGRFIVSESVRPEQVQETIAEVERFLDEQGPDHG